MGLLALAILLIFRRKTVVNIYYNGPVIEPEPGETYEILNDQYSKGLISKQTYDICLNNLIEDIEIK